jgi:hypothetical protein
VTLGSRVPLWPVLSTLNDIVRNEHPRGVIVVPQDTFDPGDYFVAGGVGGFIEVDHSRADILLQISLQRSASCWNRNEVAGSNEHCKIAQCQQIEMQSPSSPGELAHSYCSWQEATATRWSQ